MIHPDYQQFLDAKVCVAEQTGFEAPLPINPRLKPMTQAIVQWACRGGQRALFLRFGLHKTSAQLEIVRQALALAGGHGLIVAPLGVQHEFFLEVERFHPDVELRFIKRDDHPDIWSDISRMRTLNMQQQQKGREMHLCPLQFDIVERGIEQHSEPGETVFDPFGGIMTVPYCALRMGRKAIGVELNPDYWRDGVTYAEAAA